MGLILPQEVSVKIVQGNHSYLSNKGYIIPKKIGWDKNQRIDFGRSILVNVDDLPYRSEQKVEVICDYCGGKDNLMYRDVYRMLNGKVCTKICCTKEVCKKEKATEVRRINADNKFNFKSTEYRDKDWLYNEYIIKDKSAELIAEETGLGLRTIREYINKYDLAIKNGSKTNFITKEELKDLYVTQRKTTIEIGKIYNLCDNTIGELLKKFNIPIFSQSEQMKRYYYVKGGLEHIRKVSNTIENRILMSCRARNIKVEDFDGFIASKKMRLRGSFKYRDWRTSVFKRDNYTCQCCNQYGGKLQVHHIKNFSSSEDLRFEINNGITLCYDCHSPCVPNSFHSIYGKYNNNEEQLNEYIKLKQSEVV